jgi:hypothetical protein
VISINERRSIFSFTNRSIFVKEYATATKLEICSGVLAPIVSLETLLKMKRDAGRAQDLIDIEELQRLR